VLLNKEANRTISHSPQPAIDWVYSIHSQYQYIDCTSTLTALNTVILYFKPGAEYCEYLGYSFNKYVTLFCWV